MWRQSQPPQRAVRMEDDSLLQGHLPWLHSTRPGGGTGRRRGLKPLGSSERAGSNPAPGTEIESRHNQDADDHPVIWAARRRAPSLTCEHVGGEREPLLWLADAYAWLVGAGDR